MMTEKKLVMINELERGKELTNRLMNSLKHTSSVDSNNILISKILRNYQNAIFMLTSIDDKNIRKRSPEIDNKCSQNAFKKRRTSEKQTEKVRVFVGTEQEKGSIDDGYCWRKYGQKEIQGSKNPRGYFRCRHRFTQDCLALKQVQKSDTDPSIREVKYLGNHTCNSAPTNFSVSLFEEGNRVQVTEQPEDTKPTKSEEIMISLEDLENKKNIFRTFSFSNHEIENVGWKTDIFSEFFSPATSGSVITREIVSGPSYVQNSETADSYFSSLDNIIDFGQDWLWSLL